MLLWYKILGLFGSSGGGITGTITSTTQETVPVGRLIVLDASLSRMVVLS